MFDNELSFFPVLLPDETLYSGWSRFGEILGFSSVYQLTPLLFNKVYLSTRFFLESRIEAFTKNFPIGHQYNDFDYIIQNHTLFPIYSLTCDNERSNEIFEFMTGRNSNKKLRRIVQKQEIGVGRYARFCPLCRKEDVTAYGETYWHRIHQIPGIDICAKHHCYLENSSLVVIEPSSTREIGHFIAARRAVNLSSRPRFMKKENCGYNRLQFLFTEDANYWLKNPHQSLNLEEFVRLFAQILCPHVSYDDALNYMNTKDISYDIEKRYSSEVLSKLNIDLRTSDLSAIFHFRKRPAPSTLFLLMDFFGVKSDTFVKFTTCARC